MTNFFHRTLSLYLILFLGFFVSSIAGFWVYKDEKDKKRLTFKSAANQMVRSVEERVGESFDLLESLKAFYQASSFVDRDEFQTFVLPLLNKNPQIHAIEWIPKVTDDERSEYEKQAISDGFADFEFTEKNEKGQMVKAQKRPEYYPVYYVEPSEGNESAFGYDLGSQPDRLKALERAWISGKIVATAPIQLVQEEKSQYGFLLFNPIYTKNGSLKTVREKAFNLKGFALGVFRIKDLVDASLANTKSNGIYLKFFDKAEDSIKQEIYFFGDEKQNEFEFSLTHTIKIGDRTWLVTSLPATSQWRAKWYQWPLVAWTIGILFTFMVIGYLELIQKRAKKVRDLVLERTQELQEQKADAIKLAKQAEVSRDELQQSQEKLKRAQERLSFAVAGSHDGLWDWDMSTGKVHYSRGFKELLGYKDNEFENSLNSLKKAIHSEDQSYVWKSVENHLKEKLPYDVEYRMRTKRGLYRWFHARGQAIWDKSGEPMRMSGSISDVTERHNWEMDLKKAKERAEMAVKSKSEFLANMSHEIRTPMNAIIGMTDICMGTQLTAEQKGYLETIQSSGHHLLQLINDILDASKIEAGRLDLNKIVFDPRDVIESAADSISFQAGQKGIEIISFINPEIPHSLYGDPDRLRQIVINLTGNAVKFTDEGEVAIRLDLEEFLPTRCKLHFSIADSGCGIAKDLQGKIFESFTQADGSIARKYGGTGLGTTISKHLIDMMSGEIWVESPTNKSGIGGPGSTFHFVIDLDVAKEQTKDLEVILPDLKDKKVLIVDDNAHSRDLYALLLRLWGMKACSASGPDDLVGEAGDYDLALVDLVMPKMNGFELIEELKKKYGDKIFPIVMLSTSHNPEDIQKSKKMGVFGYMMKPTKQLSLKKMLVDALSQDQEKPEQAAPEEPSPSSDISSDELRILLAEDNRTNQIIAQKFLQLGGYKNITTVDNGKKAYEAIQKEEYDIVLMDMQMPEMDGLEATAAIRNLEKETGCHRTIIAMTANAMAGDKEKCLESGMDDYVSKPINKDVLFDTLAKYAGKKAA